MHPNQCRRVNVVIGILDAELGEIRAGGGRKIGGSFIHRIGAGSLVNNATKFAIAIIILFGFWRVAETNRKSACMTRMEFLPVI